MGTNLLAVQLGTDGLGNDRTAKKISLGFNHSCAILDDNTTKCWGDNSVGQLGQGDIDNRGDATGEMGDNLPAVDLGDDITAKQIALGFNYTCAILSTNNLICLYPSYGDCTAAIAPIQ